MSNVPANPSKARIGDYGTGDAAALEAVWMNADERKYEAQS
jgi:hypothetical protein